MAPFYDVDSDWYGTTVQCRHDVVGRVKTCLEFVVSQPDAKY